MFSIANDAPGPSDGGTGFKGKQMKLLETKQVSQKTVDQAILRFIVQGPQPFSLVEKPSFQDLIVELQPRSAVMSRTTVRRKIDSATSKMKESLKNVMKEDENNNEELVAEGTIEEVGEDCDASDGEEEVELIDVEAILEEDDGLQYQLPKHHRYSPADIAFLGEYVTTMSPVAKSLNKLQGEVNIQMGWLLPTITTLTTKLEKSRPSLRFCKPLVDALLEGLRKRFESMMSEPELIAAAILVPRFKTSWTSNDTVLQLGLSYIKTHLPEHDEGLRSPDTTASSSEDDDFFSNVKPTLSNEISQQLDGYLAATADGVNTVAPYPAVRNLSLKLNTALPASAACERLFSIAGLLFTPRRGSIHSQNFENQLLLKLNKEFIKFD
ncbi:uncharacterized protein LOC130387936 [Gadus chalcogrammus]|uniref:uncharacterized protein LOC130387936 n=1 Tax=Gadus chalcogrammus TaxID=1042646 RepID=UPI0024C4A8A3|nr:uncharacterized protein LOC130387936 [Gadus chalcogrammus]